MLVTHHPHGVSATAVSVELELHDIPWRRANVALFRIDGTHSNAFAANRRRMPSPPLSPIAVRQLRRAAEMAEGASLRPGLRMVGRRLRLTLLLQPFATVLVSITPFDRQPPAPPRWVEASMAGADAVLRWTPNNEPGFYGYEVLRLGAERRVAPRLLRGALWVDTAPPVTGSLRYTVRAISTSGRASPIV
ncbi:hypothetical protein, partial [Falsiroseomonas sp. HW251]|uniref:hypothetical protein n=1 Tax=Falsiroseomonas sp. HW251 TaxID=3390998 RepID=UPI003D30FDA5